MVGQGVLGGSEVIVTCVSDASRVRLSKMMEQPGISRAVHTLESVDNMISTVFCIVIPRYTYTLTKHPLGIVGTPYLIPFTDLPRIQLPVTMILVGFERST